MTRQIISVPIKTSHALSWQVSALYPVLAELALDLSYHRHLGVLHRRYQHTYCYRSEWGLQPPREGTGFVPQHAGLQYRLKKEAVASTPVLTCWQNYHSYGILPNSVAAD